MTAGIAVVAVLLHKGYGTVTTRGVPVVAPKGPQGAVSEPVRANRSNVTASSAAFGASRAALVPIGMENES